MPRAQIGRSKWRTTIRQAMNATTEMRDIITLLREDIKKLWLETAQHTPEGIEFLLGMSGKLDSLSEEISQTQGGLALLLSIGSGEGAGNKEEDDDREGDGDG